MLYIFIQVVIYLVAFVSSNNIVDTTHGKISGRVLKTLIKEVEYYGFMGIPYAAPPIKDLRFMPPKPVEPWEGILKTTKVKKACSQFNNNVKKSKPFGYYGTEDCLYLDIFTPAPDDNKRAVIMFIYNDHFTNSYNKTEDYEPDFFIEEDVVVVMISHRLSVFGFLSLEDEIMPGNAGLKDIVIGLEWINDNIERFGGDPERITLMGSQGGGVAVDLLMHSTAKDLFSAAILQGGTSWMSGYLQGQIKERAFNLVEMMNRTASSSASIIKELNEIAPNDLVARDFHASPKDYFKENQRSIVAFGPIVEKQSNGLLVEYPEDSEKKINIPIMLGFNSREGLEMSLQYLVEPRFIAFLNKDFPFLLPMRLKFRFDPFKDVFFDGIDDIKKFYFRKKIGIKSVSDFATYIGDVITAYSTNYAARVYADRSEKDVYYYHFDYVSDLNENKKNIMKLSVVEDGTHGAATGDELCYLFKCPDLKEIYLKHHNSMSEERIIQMRLIKLWTNFAKYRNPTPNDDFSSDGLNWLPYTNENKEYLHIDKQFEIKRDLYRNKFSFWDDFIRKWERKAVNGVITESFNKKDEL